MKIKKKIERKGGVHRAKRTIRTQKLWRNDAFLPLFYFYFRAPFFFVLYLHFVSNHTFFLYLPYKSSDEESTGANDEPVLKKKKRKNKGKDEDLSAVDIEALVMQRTEVSE